jgi:hypothetical protein
VLSLEEPVEVDELSVVMPALVVSLADGLAVLLVVSAFMPASEFTEAVSPVVVLGAWPIVLSVCAALAVSAATEVVSPRSGAAPTSSSDRLWQAAREAAAASINRYLMKLLLERRDPARLRVSFTVVRVPRAVSRGCKRAVTSRVARMYLAF